ncbi:MAG: penicillin-binding transpeptidase domain-containing protein [Pseudomonadota bacterium]
MSARKSRLTKWRHFQESHRRELRKKVYLGRVPWLGVYAGLLFLILVIIFYTGSWIFAHLGQQDEPSPKAEEVKEKTQQLLKEDLRGLLQDVDLGRPPSSGTYFLSREGKRIAIEPSIDWPLQKSIQNLLERSLTHQAAVVVINPKTGQVLAMVNYEKEGNGKNGDLCLKAEYPAASLFKIIAAAAAIEKRGFTPEKVLIYRGRKHTLYKSQLKEEKSRYLVKTDLKRAFSGSINPVFGKMGIYNLGKPLMDEYAARFFFNEKIPFDLPLEQSTVKVPEDEFGLAEIASGFNKRTLISPLHATLITAAIADGGVMMEPWIVKRVIDESGKTLYRVKPSQIGRPITKETARDMRVLMSETVKTGTGRKAFSALRRKKAFKNVELGAKTGTINDQLDQYKFDWMTVYALPGDGGDGVAAAVLAVHGERLGIRAKDIAKYVMGFHFNP